MFEYVSFSESIPLACKMGEFGRWSEFRKELDDAFANRNSEMDLRLRGTSLRGIGDLAMCNGDYEDSLTCYKEGFLLIVQNENLPRFAIGKHLKRTEQLILANVEKEILKKLGRDMSKFWIMNGKLMRKSPESLLTFQQWER